VKRLGYRRGIVVGLLVAGLGCLLFHPAAATRLYPLFLGALFVLASGITLLQVAANPYVTLLGPPATASSRLNLTQAFNALGTTLAPYFGGGADPGRAGARRRGAGPPLHRRSGGLQGHRGRVGAGALRGPRAGPGPRRCAVRGAAAAAGGVDRGWRAAAIAPRSGIATWRWA